jgi:LAO/AO transport system kinase
VPVLVTEATTGGGVDELGAEILRHRDALDASGALEYRRRGRRIGELRALVLQALGGEVDRLLAEDGPARALREAVEAGQRDPYGAVAEVLGRLEAGRRPSRAPSS